MVPYFGLEVLVSSMQYTLDIWAQSSLSQSLRPLALMLRQTSKDRMSVFRSLVAGAIQFRRLCPATGSGLHISLHEKIGLMQLYVGTFHLAGMHASLLLQSGHVPGWTRIDDAAAKIVWCQCRAVLGLMADLPLKKLRNFGGKLGGELEALGCSTAGEVARHSQAALEAQFGMQRAAWILQAVNGVSDEPVQVRSGCLQATGSVVARH